jgi:hypothetical protein
MRSKIKVQIRTILHDKDGRPIKKLPWKNANSLLKQFIRILATHLSETQDDTIKDITGTLVPITKHATNLNANGAITVTTKGILIGTGTTAVAMDDYKLETQVTTNIAHSAHTFVLEYPSASQARITISRIFTNNTGAVLGIKEVALYAIGCNFNTFCIERTLYAVDVPDGYPITFQYRITITL